MRRSSSTCPAPRTPRSPTARALGTITDDDAPADLVNDVTVTEGNAGTVNAVLTVTLSAPSPQAGQRPVRNGQRDGDRRRMTIWRPAGPLVVRIRGRRRSRSSVTVNGDLLDEANETFLVQCEHPSHWAPPWSTVLPSVRISNDDVLPSLSIADVSIAEGQNSSEATFTVTLRPPSGRSCRRPCDRRRDGVADSDYTRTANAQTAPAGRRAR